MAQSMKNASWTASVFTVALLAFGGIGCKKQPPQQATQPLDIGIQNLRVSLAKANSEVQSNFYNGVEFNVRYENSLQAMVFADRIVNDTSLDQKQKKLANDVIEMLKARLQAPQQKQ